MSIIPNLPQEAYFNPLSKYTPRDYLIISQAEWRIADEFVRQLSPYVKMDGIYKGMKIEFTDYATQELIDNHAVGLAWNDRNVNLIPSNIGYFDLLFKSGIMSMELAHSIIGRLTGNRRKMNNVVHYLFNYQMLKPIDISNVVTDSLLGHPMRLMVPDLAYGWLNQDMIMREIAAGTAFKGDNPYWAVEESDFTTPTAASDDEVDMIRKWLKEHGYL